VNQQMFYVAIAAVAWYFLVGPGKQAQATAVYQPPPQTSTVTGAGAANMGGCPSNLSQDQCSKYLSERIGLERDKAWAGVAGQGIAAGSGLLKGLFS
jgi:hypothetical protein